MVVAGTAVRPLDCSRRSTNDLLGRHPASTGGADHAGVAAGVGGHAARLRCEVGEGPLSSTSTESMVTRVALGGPPASLPPPSLGTCSHVPLSRRPPPCAPQRSIGRPSPLSRARGPRAAQRAIPPRLPTRAAACVFEPASATPGRTVGAQGRGPPTGVRGGIARPRRQRSPEARSSSTHPAPRYRGRPLAFRSLGPARVRALRAELSFMCIHSAPRGWDT